MLTILKGVVGSTAYGLATPNSDVDRLAFHVTPTVDLVKLHPVTKFSIQSHNPDMTTHEVGKACSLLFSGNPVRSRVRS